MAETSTSFAVAQKFTEDFLRESRSNLLQLRTSKSEVAKLVADAQTIVGSLESYLNQFGIPHRWVGTRLDLKDPEGNWIIGVDLKGDPGPQGDTVIGPKGSPPDHRWIGKDLQFANADGSWGEAVSLQGVAGPAPAHRWIETSIQFQNPDGTWGDLVDLGGGGGAPDTVPDAFFFNQVSAAELSTLYVSNAAPIFGINRPTPISVVGGEYRIGSDGVWTNLPGTISLGQTVAVRHFSSGSFESDANTTLTIGGVSSTFTTTTIAEGATALTGALHFNDPVNSGLIVILEDI